MRQSFVTDVVCSVHHTKNGRRLRSLPRNGVRKNTHLLFGIQTRVPKPYSVYWQITNTGNEAANKSDLRGGFDTPNHSDLRSRWEKAQYAGTHLVEAFIIKDGACVSRSGTIQVPIG